MKSQLTNENSEYILPRNILHSSPWRSMFIYLKMSMLARMLPVTSPWLESDSTTDENLKKTILKDERNMIVFGPSNVGKTCLLFQAGVSLAVEELIVIFVSPQPLTKMPLTIHGLHSPSATVLQSVKFVECLQHSANDSKSFCFQTGMSKTNSLHLILCKIVASFSTDFETYK
ncbi:hypothetical protein LOTGIDRAFT_154812 [Lottia gigantea]|uniref:Uncharacterized protein n=1 Tax=Lottia gigantea TaxID=225164 RepID=V3ZXG3_LOTGI|nr:hypothetical protein LOTGIDRAFT_154812 [Lottia gigantea]ESO87315.1 hypothetical protein LOTGIDRAFT_154812 [Lottia gigantea]